MTAASSRPTEVCILRLRPLLFALLAAPLLTPTTETKTVAPAVLEGAKTDVYYGRPLVRSLDLMIEELGVTVFPEDYVVAFPDPILGLGSKITIFRATPITLDDGGHPTTVRTFARTVKELLAERGIVLGAADLVEPEEEAPLSWEGRVAVIRVEETELVEWQSIPFRTVTRDDPNLLQGTTRVEQEGRAGVKELTFRVRRENGREVFRELLAEQVISQPVDRVVIRGTKVWVARGPWEAIIREVAPRYGADPDGLIRIMYCESGGNALSYNRSGPYYGLFQFSRSTFTRLGYAADQIWDPQTQIEAAARLWGSRYHHWPTCAQGT